MMEIVGLPLSVAAFAVFVVLLLDWRRRRGSFEPMDVAGYRVDAGRMQWVWLVVLVGSFAASTVGPTYAIATHERPLIERPPGSASEPGLLVRTTRRLNVGVMLPFYRYNRAVLSSNGAVQRVTITRQLVLPLWFIAGAWLYWLLVLQRSRAVGPAAGAAPRRT